MLFMNQNTIKPDNQSMRKNPYSNAKPPIHIYEKDAEEDSDTNNKRLFEDKEKGSYDIRPQN